MKGDPDAPPKAAKGGGTSTTTHLFDLAAMTLAVSHTFVNPHSDGADATRVRPSTWNGTASHTISGLADITQGGTGASSVASARSNLGLGTADTPTFANINTPVFTSVAKGLTPLSGGGTANFLRADGTWAVPPSSSTSPGGSSTQIQYNSSGAFAADANLTWTTGAGLGLLDAQHMAIGNDTGGVSTDTVLKIRETFSNADMEGSAFDSSAGLTVRAVGHKTSGSMGQIAGLLIAAECEVDAGLTARAVQAAQLSGYLTGGGQFTSGMQAVSIEATVEISNTTGQMGYLSAFEAYANLNTASTCTVVYGAYLQAYTDAAVVVPDFFACVCNVFVDDNGSATRSCGLEITAQLDGTVATSYMLHVATPTGTTPTVTNHYGISIEDQTGIGVTNSENFRSKGATSKNLFEGNVVASGHTAVGRDATDIDATLLGSPVSFALDVRETQTGNLPGTFRGGILVHTHFNHTGPGTFAFAEGMLCELFVDAASVGDWGEIHGVQTSINNEGSGHVGQQIGVQALVRNMGSGTVDEIYGVQSSIQIGDPGGSPTPTTDFATCFLTEIEIAAGSSVTTLYGIYVDGLSFLNPGDVVDENYGIYIRDQKTFFGSGAGSATVTANYNFYSAGAASLNVFEGIVRFGTATNSSPSNGDLWFDGTNLKLRTGGTTKTITAV